MDDIISDFFNRLVFIDVLVFGILGFIHVAAWRGVNESPPAGGVNNKAISAAAQAALAGLGILIGASFVVIQLSQSSTNPPPASVGADGFFATVWFIIALGF